MVPPGLTGPTVVVVFVRTIRGRAWNTMLCTSALLTTIVCSLMRSPNEEVARMVYVPSGTPLNEKLPFESDVAVKAVPTISTVAPLTPFCGPLPAVSFPNSTRPKMLLLSTVRVTLAGGILLRVSRGPPSIGPVE